MNIKVLIVEDDRNYRYAVRSLVDWEGLGFQIVGEAVHGKQALQFLERHEVDLILSDMSMPLMNGVELIQEAKKRYPFIEIIALSAYDDFCFVKDSLKYGARDYILKQEMKKEDVEKVVLEVKLLLEQRQEKNQLSMLAAAGKSLEIKRAITYIVEHYGEDLTLGGIAENVGLSENYLSNLFKAETQKNITRFINEVRVEKAKVLLQETNKKVYEIGEAVGFKNTTYFSTVFKKIAGKSIQEYRESGLS